MRAGNPFITKHRWEREVEQRVDSRKCDCCVLFSTRSQLYRQKWSFWQHCLNIDSAQRNFASRSFANPLTLEVFELCTKSFLRRSKLASFYVAEKSIRRKMDFCVSSAKFFVVASLALDTLSDLRSNKLEAEHKAPMTFLLCPRSFLLTENLFLWRVSFWISFCRRRRDSELRLFAESPPAEQIRVAKLEIRGLCRFPRSLTRQSAFVWLWKNFQSKRC